MFYAINNNTQFGNITTTIKIERSIYFSRSAKYPQPQPKKLQNRHSRQMITFVPTHLSIPDDSEITDSHDLILGTVLQTHSTVGWNAGTLAKILFCVFLGFVILLLNDSI